MPLPAQLAAIGARLGQLGDQASNVVGGLNNSWQNAAKATGVPQAIGGATGALGGALGAIVGAIGNPIANTIQGKPTFQDWGKDVVDTAKSTAGAGYQMGEQGAIQAPLGFGGKIVRGAMAIPPAMNAVNDVKSGNIGLSTGLNAGAAALGAYGAATDPNWTPGGILDSQLKALGSQIAESAGGLGGTMHKASYQMLAQAIRDSDVPAADKQAFLQKLYPGLQNDNPNFDSGRFDAAVNDGTLTRASSASPRMSKMDYELMADAFKQAKEAGVSDQSLNAIYSKMLPGFSQANQNFDAGKFLDKAGLGITDAKGNLSIPGENIKLTDSYGLTPEGEAYYSVSDQKYAAQQLADSLGLNAKFLLKNAQKNGVDLKAMLGKLDSSDPETLNKLTFSNDLMGKVAPDAGPQSGPWTDAYSRPMRVGYGLGDGNVTTAPETPQQAYKGMSAQKVMESNAESSGKGMASYPNLTPSQQGAVTKLIKQGGGYQKTSPTDVNDWLAAQAATDVGGGMPYNKGQTIGTPGASDIGNSIRSTPEYKGMDSTKASMFAEGWGDGENATQAQQAAAWQYINDTGIWRSLQGWYGRNVQNLVDQGLIGPPPAKN